MAVHPHEEAPQTSDETPIEDLLFGKRKHWLEGPPHELFKRARNECPVHWSAHLTEWPAEEGFHSVTTWDDLRSVSMDWQTYSSEVGGITALTNSIMPLEMQRGMFIAQDPPKHDRLKALFQRGFTPKRIAEHEERIRQIVRDRLEGLDPHNEINLVDEFAQPVVARVIGSFMGTEPEDDVIWARLMNATLGGGDPDLNPEGPEAIMQKEIPEIFERCQKMIDARRDTPQDDLTTVLVNAEVEGSKLEDWEIVMGFFLLMAAGNDSTKATFCSAINALVEHPEEKQK